MTHAQKLQLKSALSMAEMNGVHCLTTRKTREAFQFRTMREASAFARLVGWQANDVIRGDVMGFIIWVICDPHMNYLTARGALRCLLQRGTNPELEEMGDNQ